MRPCGPRSVDRTHWGRKQTQTRASRREDTRVASAVLYHPDYTVGPGITPGLLTLLPEGTGARGLTRFRTITAGGEFHPAPRTFAAMKGGIQKHRQHDPDVQGRIVYEGRRARDRVRRRVVALQRHRSRGDGPTWRQTVQSPGGGATWGWVGHANRKRRQLLVISVMA